MGFGKIGRTVISGESGIQIEQRQARCARCGKMINLRGSHLTDALRDGTEVFFCSELCRGEYATLFGLIGDDAASPGERA